MPLLSLRDVRRMRRKLGLTQKEVAERAGVSQPLIARIENDDVDPRWSTLQRIVRALESAAGKERTLGEVMSRDVVSIPTGAPLEEAIRKMRQHAYSQLPVVDDDRVIGSISERAVVHAMAEHEDPRKVRGLTVDEVMEDALPTLGPETPAEAALELIEEVPAVLVVEDDRLVGVVTRTDLLNLLEV